METINIYLSNIDRDSGTASNFNIDFIKYGLNSNVKHYVLEIYECGVRNTALNVNGIYITSTINQINTINTAGLNILIYLSCISTTSYIYSNNQNINRCVIENPLHKIINFQILDAGTRAEVGAPNMHMHLKLRPLIE